MLRWPLFLRDRAWNEGYMKKAAPRAALCVKRAGLALTCLEPTLCLVDHIDTALAAHNAAIAVPVLQRAERVPNLHSSLLRRGADLRHCFRSTPNQGLLMVGGTGIEPVTPTMST